MDFTPAAPAPAPAPIVTMQPVICLSMIIKNESRVITRLLESAYRFIDCFCICDTGSDDNTVELVENFMRERGVPGRVIHEPFRDFEYNRNFALRAAEATVVAAQGSFQTAEATTVAKEGSLTEQGDGDGRPTHILLLDADMVFWGAGSESAGREPTAAEIAAFRAVLAEDAHEAFYVFQGSEKFFYKNVRVVRTGLDIHYKSVTHEYICTPEGARYHTFPRTQVFIHDVGDGGSKQNKFERDIRLLTADLEKNPTNVRSWFYLANSYHDSGKVEKAIEAYTRRIELGGWIEEIFYSHYRIGQCYKRLGRPRDAIIAWMDAYQSFPYRIEPLYEIVHHYRCAGQNNLAYMFYVTADKVRRANPHPDFLFVNYEIYTWKLDYEMSIIGYYCNTDKYSLTALSHVVLDRPASDVENYIVQNVLSNYKFYAAAATQKAVQQSSDNRHMGNLLKVLAAATEQSKQKVLEYLRDSESVCVCESVCESESESESEKFFSSTPTFCMSAVGGSGGTQIILNVRFVNYRIGERGEYINQEKIETINVMSILSRARRRNSGGSGSPKNTFDYAYFSAVTASFGMSDDWVLSRLPEIMPHDRTKDNVYVGIEDVRLHASRENGLCLYNGNRGLGQSHIIVETGVVDLRGVVGTAATMSGFITLPDKQKDVEKNWVMFEPATAPAPAQQQHIKYVYGWSPLVIGDGKKISSVSTEHIFCETHRIDTPPFFRHLRGSTNGISVSSDTSDPKLHDEIWFMTHVVSYEDRRFYYHVVVVLDATTFRVKRYTKMFTFEGAPVEYCLGFLYFPAPRVEDATFLVGYSVMDRETKYATVSREFFENLMITCD